MCLNSRHEPMLTTRHRPELVKLLQPYIHSHFFSRTHHQDSPISYRSLIARKWKQGRSVNGTLNPINYKPFHSIRNTRGGGVFLRASELSLLQNFSETSFRVGTSFRKVLKLEHIHVNSKINQINFFARKLFHKKLFSDFVTVIDRKNY